MSPNIPTLLFCLAFLSIFAVAHGHLFMGKPPIRGLLAGHNLAPWLKPVRGAPRDYSAHFPAGDKNLDPGSGLRSQKRALHAQNATWAPFFPRAQLFTWRAGICGDNYGGKQDHMRGGRFYFNAYRAATYTQGQVIDVRMTVAAHHNGYMELHVCDVKQCGGEISESCFKRGVCKQVRRAPNPICDRGGDWHCGPIHRRYPGRWYFPCAEYMDGEHTLGGRYAKFRLPSLLHCDHCVLHFFYTSANTCNPHGVLDYFNGPDRPRAWGDCEGQSGALGGVTRVQPKCGPNRVPEEYYQCADIRIKPRPKPKASLLARRRRQRRLRRLRRQRRLRKLLEQRRRLKRQRR